MTDNWLPAFTVPKDGTIVIILFRSASADIARFGEDDKGRAAWFCADWKGVVCYEDDENEIAGWLPCPPLGSLVSD